MQSTLNTGEILSEHDLPVAIEEEVVSMQKKPSKTKGPGKVILSYIPPSRYGAQTKKPMKNPKWDWVLSLIDKVYRNMEWDQISAV